MKCFIKALNYLVVLFAVGCWPTGARAQKADEQTKGKAISWSGLVWNVKSSTKRVGPGPNLFSRENVWIDAQDRLHLKVSSRKNEEGDLRWYCAEIVSQASFGYGTYRWYLDTPIKQDPHVVLGLFTWDNTSSEDHHREIDIELISTWGSAESDQNAQFVVQPWTTKANRHRFHLSSEHATTTHCFVWKTNSVEFLSLIGHRKEADKSEKPLEQWVYRGPDVPRPGAENARINLWLLKRPTEEVPETEVILSRFEFEPVAGSGGEPEVVIASLPPASLQPGSDEPGRISGVVRGSNLGDCKVIVYAYGDKWYAQPLAAAPDTRITDGKWSTTTHGGTEYAVILVKSSYAARPTLADLPEVDVDVLAVARKKPQ